MTNNGFRVFYVIYYNISCVHHIIVRRKNKNIRLNIRVTDINELK